MTRPSAAMSAATAVRSKRTLTHQLQVHRIELEAQNEELRRIQLDLAAARDRYVGLYDFAPVGYLTLDARGAVVEANLTAAALFDEPRQTLIGLPFVRFVAPADLALWQRHLRQSLAQDAAQRIELALRRRHGDVLHGQLDSRRVAAADAEPSLRATLIDITQRHLAETNRRIAETAVRAREAERQRIARELHEELGQRLSALKMIAARAGVGGMALDTLDEAIAAVRRISAELGPLMLGDLGLNAALDALVRDTARRTGLRVRQRVDDTDPSLDAPASATLYRIAQEMLGALEPGSRATTIDVRLHQEPNELCLTLLHDGAAPAAFTDPASGWRGLVHLLGGRVDIADKPLGRARLDVRVPLRAAVGAAGAAGAATGPFRL